MSDVLSAPGEPEPWFAGRILSRDPLITITAAEIGRMPLRRLPPLLPDLFYAPTALHFLTYTHSLEVYRGAENVAAEIVRAQAELPGHVFAPLIATEYEGWLLARHGIPGIMGNGAIFTDERVWKPVPPMVPGLRIHDAVYCARLAPGKRHELAAKIPNLMLIYPHALSHPDDEAYARVKALLPEALFANHELTAGRYERFEAGRVVNLLAHAKVGLALSAAEGSMRAAMEYLLSGLPVVSTRSIGGRDRYFGTGYCRVVDDDPDAVAGAVAELARANLDRRRVRAHVAEMLGFDRYNFLLNANKVAKSVFGRDNLIPTIDPFVGLLANFLPLSRLAAEWARETNSVPVQSQVGAPDR